MTNRSELASPGSLAPLGSIDPAFWRMSDCRRIVTVKFEGRVSVGWL